MESRAHNRSTASDVSSDQEVSSEEIHIRNFAKQMLRGKIFVGTYYEKRHVECINAYRDIVQISNLEKDLIRDINVVLKRISNHFKTHWIGITSPEMIGAPVGNCFWVELEQEVFGSYWYKIKGVKFRKNEIVVQLKQVRPIEEVKDDVRKTEADVNLDSSTIDYKELLTEKFKECMVEVWKVLTYRNIKESVVYLSILIVTLIAGAVQLFQYLMDFSLKLMREMSIFMHSVNPVLISVVDMVGKVIGGFYLLIAMIWRDRNGPRQGPYQQNMMLTYKNAPRSSVTIREITE